MTQPQNLALQLSRRQKRLQSWIEDFKNLPATEAEEVHRTLTTYSLLIAKIAKNPESPEVPELEERLTTIERDLTQLFEDVRLRTSNVHN